MATDTTKRATAEDIALVKKTDDEIKAEVSVFSFDIPVLKKGYVMTTKHKPSSTPISILITS